MKRSLFSSRNKLILLIWVLIFISLYWISFHNYLLFHSFAEVFSIVVACGIFMIAWNSRSFIDNHYLLFIGIAYLFVGAVDLIHTLAYKGMGVFKGSETNLATQLWITARYIESLSLLIAPYFIKRKLNPYSIFVGYMVTISLLLSTIFYWDIFPVCFVEGSGLTSFKILSEYIISTILLLAIGLLLKHRQSFDQKVLHWILWSLIITIVSELAFTFYIHAYGFSNMIGHFLKIISFYLIYKAIIETGLSQPYHLLFLNLNQTLESLEASEERFRSVVQTAGDAIISIDRSGKIIFWNHGAEKMFGYPASEILGKPLLSIIPDPFREAHQNGIERFLTSGITQMIGKTVDMAGLRKDGSQFPIELSLATWETKEGTFFTAILRDITERKEMEEQLRQSKDELEFRVQERTAELATLNQELIEQSRILESFFKHTITPLVLLDKDFNFIRVNSAYAKACQREVSEFPGHNHFEFYPSDARIIFEQVVETKTPYQAVAKPFVFPDHPEWGETYWDWTLTPILNDSDEVEFLVFSLNDVTERTRAQKAQTWLTAILEATSDFVGVTNPEGKLLYLNQSARRMLGMKGGEDLSKFRILDSHPEWARSIVIQEGIPTAMRDGIWKGEAAFLNQEGKEIPVSQVILSHRSSEGKIQYFSTIARDITEKKEEERRITIRNALLELYAKKTSRKEYIESVVHLFQEWSQCRCLGIRVLEHHGIIPYEAYVGFSREFWESENWLSLREHQCACIRVILGEIDPQEASVVTPSGSFCCGNTPRFIEKLSESEKMRYRSACVQNGFLSVAIVPIRYQKKIIGAIHLADEMENKISFHTLEFIESLTPLVGEAIIRFNLEEELKDSESRLRFLSSELLKVQENERKRIAREIHDSIGQTLAAIKFGLESKLSQAGKGIVPQGITLEDIISLTQTGIEEARRIQMDLRPSILDDLGILSTLAWFIREFQKIYTHIHIERKTALEEEDIPDHLKIVLYRIIQEAMNNIAKHSQADFIFLSLEKVQNRIELTIEDNGLGFDPEMIDRGTGLTGMRERAELSGGTFEIQSILDQGTKIRASWPI